jgi:hypothetical protein
MWHAWAELWSWKGRVSRLGTIAVFVAGLSGHLCAGPAHADPLSPPSLLPSPAIVGAGPAAAVIIGVSPAPKPAAPQSAEEMVAFMLWGLEDGATTKRVAENGWAAEGHNGDRIIFGILRLTDCRFRVSSQLQRAGAHDVLEFDYVLDFAAVHSYSAWFANGRDQRIIVKIEGHGWYSKTVRSKATGQLVQNVSAGSVDTYMAGGGSVERLQSTFAHFRSTFCRAVPTADSVQSD